MTETTTAAMADMAKGNDNAPKEFLTKAQQVKRDRFLRQIKDMFALFQHEGLMESR